MTSATSLYWFGAILFAARITIGVAVGALALGLLVGLAGAAGLLRRSGAIYLLTRAFGTTICGIPELLTVMIVYYGGQIGVNELASSLGVESIDVNPFFAGVLALGVVFGAYAMEVIAGAVGGVAAGQGEAARSLGLSRWHTARFVTFPQAFRIALPGLANLWLVLIKETALVSAIALEEIANTASMAVTVTKRPFLYFAFACLLYLVLTKVSMMLQAILQRRLTRGGAFNV